MKILLGYILYGLFLLLLGLILIFRGKEVIKLKLYVHKRLKISRYDIERMSRITSVLLLIFGILFLIGGIVCIFAAIIIFMI